MKQVSKKKFDIAALRSLELLKDDRDIIGRERLKTSQVAKSLTLASNIGSNFIQGSEEASDYLPSLGTLNTRVQRSSYVKDADESPSL